MVVAQIDDSHATIKNQEIEEHNFSFLGTAETRTQRLERKIRENLLVPICEFEDEWKLLYA